MLRIACIQNNASFLLRRKGERNVGRRASGQRVKGQEGVVMKTDAGKAITKLSSKAGRTFADIVQCTARLETHAVFAVVLLAWTRLWIQHFGHWRNLTEVARIAIWTFTPVRVHAVNAGATILAQMLHAIVYVCGAVQSRPPQWTDAAVVAAVLHAGSPVLAGIVGNGTKVNLCFAILATEARLAFALVALDQVHTSGVVLALVANAIVNIVLAVVTLVAHRTVAGEAASLQYLARRPVFTGIAETGVDFVLAMSTKVPGRTDAVILQEWQ